MYSAIVLTAGTGSRMNLGHNKMIITYKDKYLFEYAVDTFKSNELIDEIIVVYNKDDLELMASVLGDKVSFIEGSDTRQNSVYQGIKNAKNSICIVHDGSRIFYDKEMLEKTISEIDTSFESHVLTLNSVDTLYEVKDNQIVKLLDRNNIKRAQTPQIVKKDIYLDIYNKDKQYTDEASMFIDNNKSCKILTGFKDNIKITYKGDLDE
ncbi:MAG: 2-C-methyl-D-erythritol 4-phosphate cytidylyltransferase [Mycoplasmatales bacterium]